MRQRIRDVRVHVAGAGWRNFVYVVIQTDEGLTGLGEASLEAKSEAVAGCVKDLQPYLIGQDAFRVEHIWQQMYRHSFWRGGPVIGSAISGIEMALMDIKAKALGVPVYQLLGGRVRDRVRMYANGPRGDTPEQVAKSAASLVARGFTALKWCPFPATPIAGNKRFVDAAVDQVQAVREAVGPEVDLLIDAHGRLSPAMAIRAAEALAPLRITFLEEPCLPENVDAMARVAKLSKIPIATGERLLFKFGFREPLEKRVCAVIQPDLAHCGGLLEGRKIAAMAEAHFIQVAPHNPLSWVNTLASLHLDMAIPNFLLQEFVTDPQPWMDELVRDPLPLEPGGYMRAPDKPGLGIELNEAALAKYPPLTVTMPSLWHEDGSVADW